MKKIIILLITIILLTGCNASYDINFNKDKIEDSIKIYTSSKNINNATNETTNNFTDEIGNWERGYEYYKREIYTTDKITGYNYTYNFNYNEYDAMSQLRKCYKDFDLTYTEDSITLNTSNEFLCSSYYKDINNIDINISSEYEIINSNADIKNNNTHTWNISKTNSKNKPIKLTISKKNEYQNTNNDKNDKFNIKSILILIIFILLIVVLIIRKKDDKNNSR